MSKPETTSSKKNKKKKIVFTGPEKDPKKILKDLIDAISFFH